MPMASHGAASLPAPGSPRHRVGRRVRGHAANAHAGHLGGRGAPVVLDALGLELGLGFGLGAHRALAHLDDALLP